MLAGTNPSSNATEHIRACDQKQLCIDRKSVDTV